MVPELLPSAAAALARFNASSSVGSCSRGCTAPDRLHWWGVPIGDAGCSLLGEMIEAQPKERKPLSNLLIGQSGVGDACMGTLAKVAANGHFRSLRALGISRNRVSNVGCEALAAAMADGRFPMLRDIYLSQQAATLGDRCAAALGAALASHSGPTALEKISAGDNAALTIDGLISLLQAIGAAPGGGYLGAPNLRELSLRNISNLCDALTPRQRDRLLRALSGLAPNETSGQGPRSEAGARARTGRLRRRVHVVLKSPACHLAAQDPAWRAASARWAEHGEVRVSLL